MRHIEAPPVSKEFLAENPVYLVSADLPGCGSSTVAKSIAQRITEITGEAPEFKAFGDDIRKDADVKGEEELAARRDEIPNDPEAYDKPYYESMSANKTYVVDGKLATIAGLKYIAGERPIVSINLTSNVLTSAKRITQREEKQRFHEIIDDPIGTNFLGRVSMQLARAKHENDMRQKLLGDSGETPDRNNVSTINIDTSQMYSAEISEYFRGDAASVDFESYVPKWEVDAIRTTVATLAYVHATLDDHIHPGDLAHYQYQHQSLRYNLERLMTTLHPSGIADIREQLRKSIIDCWFGLMMKETPRFFTNGAGELTLDTKSHKWTPEFYKIAEGWPTLSTMLKNKEILDPFAGAGTLAHLLVAREVVAGAQLSDIAFKGGEPLDDDGNTYDSELNSQMTQILFDDLPSWYKPDFSKITNRVPANVLDLPMKDSSVDFVVTDPPYGRNLHRGGIALLVRALGELDRVSREGSILMMPVEWATELEEAGQKLIRLTGDVSRGHSKLPVCYVHIPPNNK